MWGVGQCEVRTRFTISAKIHPTLHTYTGTAQCLLLSEISGARHRSVSTCMAARLLFVVGGWRPEGCAPG